MIGRRAPTAAPCVVLALLVLALSGCFDGGNDSDGPAFGDRSSTDNGTEGDDGMPGRARARAAWNLTLEQQPAEETATPIVKATVLWHEDPGRNRTVTLSWTAPHVSTVSDLLVFRDGSELQRSATRSFDLPYGLHTLAVHAQASPVPGESRASTVMQTLVLVRWAPVELVINASEPYAGGQNVFRERWTMPFAPWADEDAFTILLRAADEHGFEVEAHYDEEHDTHVIGAINGTRADTGDGSEGRVWRALLDGEPVRRPIDDTFPEAGDALEMRFVRCDDDDHCEGMDG